MKKYSLLLILIGVLSITSCKKFVEGYRKDPNGFVNSTTKQEMLATMLQNQFFHKGDGMRLAMLWMNQATGADRQYKVLDDWNNATSKNFNNPWSEVYKIMTHAMITEKMANEDGNQVTRGLAKMFRAWAGGEAASLWGNVPFTQVNDPNHEEPIYENQADVFASAQALLDDAITDLNSGIGVIDSDKDIYFKGNTFNWVKIAHGIKARLYLHAKDYSHALQEAQLGPSSSAAGNNLYELNDDLYALYESFDDTPWGKYNPTKQFLIQRAGDLDATDTYAGGLFSSRQNSKTNEGGRKAFNYTGLNLNAAYQGDDKIGKFFGNMNLITYGEMLLIQTECILRDNTKTVADALVPYNTYRNLLNNRHYVRGFGNNNAVKYLPYDPADFNNGGMENLDNIDPKKAFLREVFEERYLFFIGDYESFIDHARSYNDPMVPQYMELSDYDDEPLRFVYPEVEEDANDNFPGSVSITTPLPLYN